MSKATLASVTSNADRTSWPDPFSSNPISDFEQKVVLVSGSGSSTFGGSLFYDIPCSQGPFLVRPVLRFDCNALTSSGTAVFAYVGAQHFIDAIQLTADGALLESFQRPAGPQLCLRNSVYLTADEAQNYLDASCEYATNAALAAASSAARSRFVDLPLCFQHKPIFCATSRTLRLQVDLVQAASAVTTTTAGTGSVSGAGFSGVPQLYVTFLIPRNPAVVNSIQSRISQAGELVFLGHTRTSQQNIVASGSTSTDIVLQTRGLCKSILFGVRLSSDIAAGVLNNWQQISQFQITYGGQPISSLTAMPEAMNRLVHTPSKIKNANLSVSATHLRSPYVYAWHWAEDPSDSTKYSGAYLLDSSQSGYNLNIQFPSALAGQVVVDIVAICYSGLGISNSGIRRLADK